jgi:hypothetical protein
MVMSTIAVTGDMMSGKKASDTRPMPKPASPCTNDAIATITAPSAH